MIIALATALLMLTGGGAVGYLYKLDDLEKRVKSEVADESRRDAAAEVVKDMQENDKNFREKLMDFADNLGEQFNDGVATEEEVEALTRPLSQDIKDYQRDIIDKRFELREQVERDEWAAIFPPEQDV